MSVKYEKFDVNGTQFVRAYSDENRYVVRNGEPYEVAEDLAELGRKYTEGDYIETDETSVMEKKAAAYDILTGVTE